MIPSRSFRVCESETDIALTRRSGEFDTNARTALTSASATNATTHGADSIRKVICSMRSGRSSRPCIARVRRRLLGEELGILTRKAIVLVNR
jgi:hypothetical protein